MQTKQISQKPSNLFLISTIPKEMVIFSNGERAKKYVGLQQNYAVKFSALLFTICDVCFTGHALWSSIRTDK